MKRFLSLMMALAMLTSLAMADEATPTDVAEAPSAPETVPETVEYIAPLAFSRTQSRSLSLHKRSEKRSSLPSERSVGI